MEARVAKLEAAVEHIQADVADLKSEFRSFRTQTHDDLASLNGRLWTMFLWLVAALAATAVGLAGLMAKGFGWLKF